MSSLPLPWRIFWPNYWDTCGSPVINAFVSICSSRTLLPGYVLQWLDPRGGAGEQQLGGCLRYGYGDRSADTQPSHWCAPLFLSEHISWWWGGEYSDVASVYEVTSSIGSVLNSISDQYLFLGKWARHWFIVLDFYCRLKRQYSEYIQTKDHLNELCSI